MSDLVLIVRLAGERVAILADSVSSVIELDEIAPVPQAAPHIAGLTALRSRVLTVVNGYRAVGVPHPAPTGREAVVVELDGHHYAVTVDRVDDVIHAAAFNDTPMALKGGWSRVASGMVEADGDLLLLVDAAALIAGPEALAA